MKFAILGTDSCLLQLAAAAKDEGHEIVWVGDIRPEDIDIVSQTITRRLDPSHEWESLLDRAIADAVLVGRGTESDELRAEQLKRLAAEAVPLLLVHPACESVLTYYEVDMTRRETGGIIRHYNPVAGHPIIADVARWIRDGHPTIGPVHQLTCERRVADGSRTSVLNRLARDVEPLAAAAGDIRRVSAIGPNIDKPSFASLQVQMTCDSAASLRWSVASLAGTYHDLVITLVGEQGTVALRIPATADRRQTWEIEVISSEHRDRQALAPYEPALIAIRELVSAVEEDDAERRSRMSTWDAATRAMEVVDAIELSLEKGRTMDVHQQQLTERLAFRGTMSALGCGLLLMGFMAVVFVTLVGGAEGKERPHLLRSWPIVLLALLAGFLLLQMAPLLIAKRKRSADPGNVATK
jgi:hypothetical protein